MANWLGQMGDSAYGGPPPGTLAAKIPYRGMPLPLSAKRDWRPVVERGLAVFNAVALLAVALWWAYGDRGFGDSRAQHARVLTAVALGGTAGFLGWFAYGLRLKLIFVSGLVWVTAGAVTLAYGLTPFPYILRLSGHPFSATPGGFLFVAVGALSVMTFLSRDRTRQRPGARLTTAARSSASSR